jgi:branched-chain amino acid transport system substrate-binding protein
MHKESTPKIYSERDYTIRMAHRQSVLRLIFGKLQSPPPRPLSCQDRASVQPNFSVYSGCCSLLIISIILILTLAGCTASPESGAPPTLKIGLVAPFEGLHRPLGYEALFGVKLALQEKNQAGGLHGYRIELVALNDFDEPAKAKTQARALVADPDVLGVVGHLSTATTEVALPIYEEAGLAVSVPWTMSAANRASGVVSIAADLTETRALVANVIQASGYSKVMTLTSKDEIILTPGNIQAVELATDGVTAGEIALTLQKNSLSWPLFGQVDVGSPQLLQVAAEAANGLTYVSPGPGPADIVTDGFVQGYQTMAGYPPGPRAILAYDAANVLLEAIEQTMPTDGSRPTRAEVSLIINRVQHQGLSGDITFERQGQRVNAPIWLYQIFNEEYPGKLVTP